MPREITLENLDLSTLIKAGDTVTWGQACAEPLDLTRSLLAQRDRIGPFRVFVGLSLSETLAPQHLADIEVLSYGSLGTNSRLGSGLQVLPCNYSALPQMMADGRFGVNVVLVQLSGRGPDGRYSLGLASDYLIPAMQRARVVIAEVNEHVPCTPMAEPLDESLIDIIVTSSTAPAYNKPASIGETESKIATHLQDVIEDGAVIQYGIGSVPSAILASLSDHRNIGIHSGMLTDDIIPLLDAGVITNSTNVVSPGRCVGALGIGTEQLGRFMHLNPAIELHPATTTHSPSALAQQDRLVAINSAIEVDLYGQVNAEVIGGRYVGAIGGQVDFMHAASTQPRGLSIIAMPSVTHTGKHSRIVDRLNGALVTTGKSDVDIVATEHGVADLRGKTLAQRRAALLDIAAPEFREALASSSHGSHD